MSNKKLFWIAFFTLSFCEFGQFAYSKNTTDITQEAKLGSEAMDCHKIHTLENEFESNGNLKSSALPR